MSLQKWHLVSLILGLILSVSLSINIYQILTVSGLSSRRNPQTVGNSDGWSNLTFTWGSEAQHIVDGTFTIDIAFKVEGDSLTMIFKCNDNEYSESDYLGLAFFNGTELIPISRMNYVFGLWADNMTETDVVLTDSGFIGFHYCPLEPGPQTVTFDNQTGYTFTVRFPWMDQYGREWNPTALFQAGAYPWVDFSLLHVCFDDSKGGFVCTRFNVYL